MDVVTNGHALAIVVGPSIVLPTGRVVRCADINMDAWEPADADPEDVPAVCLTAAREEEAAQDRRAPPIPKPVPIPDAPRPFVEDPACADFIARANQLIRVSAARGDSGSRVVASLIGYIDIARQGTVTTGMLAALEKLEEYNDPSVTAKVASDLDALAERFAAVGDGERVSLARNCAATVRRQGFTTNRLTDMVRKLTAQAVRLESK